MVPLTGELAQNRENLTARGQVQAAGRLVALEYALSARTRCGPVRGLPRPRRSTRRWANRCSKTGASPARPTASLAAVDTPES